MREIPTPAGRRPARRLLVVGLVLLGYASVTVVLYRTTGGGASGGTPAAVRPPPRDVSIRDGQFLVGGEPFLVKAVGWDPARPGELPWTRTPDPALVEEDFVRIRRAGFNTIRSWAPLSDAELRLAHEQRLRVLQGIWTAPDADFRDAGVRRRTLDQVRRVVETARWSPAVLGYLVMNEPRAAAVARAGLEASASFLREVAATVRALDPGTPVGYASWPGLEALDDELLDFVAFNLYPHRPRAVMDELGLVGYVRLLGETVARGRPLLVSEFGVSVSEARVAGRGGASEREQADLLVDLAGRFAEAGVAGTALFQWNDGWWKNFDRPGDENEHDPADPEEWFGLLRFEGPEDRAGRPRPALAAITRANRAIVVEPRSGEVPPLGARVRIQAGERVTLVAEIDARRLEVPLRSAERGWYEGVLPVPAEEARLDVRLEVRGADGDLIRRERRLLRVGRGPGQVVLSPARQVIRPGAPFAVEVELRGARGRRTLTVAAYTEDRHNEERVPVRPGRDGRARIRLTAPSEETLLALVAFEDDPALPPAERGSARAVVEVRR
jgi:hypothetical protein